MAFDFGKLQFGPEMALHIYGTPGQSRFDFMWDILIRKAHAYTLLVAAHRPNEFRYARRILSFMSQRAHIPTIVGMTHIDLPGAWSIENVALALGYVNETGKPPIITVNPTEQQSVAQAVIALIEHYMQNAMDSEVANA